MTALAQGTQRPQLSDDNLDALPQKGGTVIFQGALVMVDTSGYLRPAGALAGAFCVGVARPRDRVLDRYDATSLADGALTVTYEEGVFGFKNDGTNPILSTTQPGTKLYAVDDQTVSVNAGTNRAFAGRLERLDPSAPGGPVLVKVTKAIGAQLAGI
jgi:hypothetical protein